MNKILVRLRGEYGNYLAVGAAGVSLVIKKGGEYDPSGFELDEDLYERFREYLEVVSGEGEEKGKWVRTPDLYFYGCDGF
ncbi:MAG: hypothetical protein KAU24_02435, partial [Candidatus Aenigmarchaeota archaeon]|nr:hypothetical protein [Candidatus Aenigmarchaeota archaeon]